MTTLEWIAQGTLLLLLAAALPLLLRVAHGVAALRRDPAALSGAAEALAASVRDAEAALERLRAAGGATEAALATRIAAAESLRQDLRFLLERAEPLADRLEAAVARGRAAAPPALASRAERDLLLALERAR
ncbi:DUF6468 domain-containing protein [Roseomonas sp. CCTCC AB2023176]|uniref:DUF6468 domain-containing protein n=1 Tax=Roseomonas sp. CCTCC AB2023176 TaxID=3342640 RepID=UPI0035E0F9D9